ncbi:hypothetical protein AQJ66_18835 [Streptomyces bungoensis]|uniref:Uncharacterized protein n=1 Tax=Streptomyces bungoensis TaxID=285568 RepID=A0A117RCK8_9ACTN|nr:hypothetical protein [Streptomyces bungoensis]KUN83461.1 hypothetical protein AQJ66_18835 [Streptomyces bungoensis]
MAAEHEDSGQHGGMDALMAAITGEPLPQDARRDPAFLAEHHAAEADVAVLREQLNWLAEALTGQPRAGESGAEGTARAPDGEEAGLEGAGPGGSASSTGSAEPAELAGSTPRKEHRPRGAGRPAGGARPAGAPRAGRPVGRRRGLRFVVGSVGGVAALGMVVGLFWLGAQPGGGASMGGGGSADAKSRADAPAPGAGRPADPVAALACYRLVAEGTVAAVDRHSQRPWIRVVVTVARSYKPAHGPGQVSFLLAGDAEPAPLRGQHVLAGVGRGRQDAGLWAVGDARVAEQRAWITEALPGSRHATCPR